ncbi:hypothetical protein WJ47_12370 [Burkholderia ubonensis]|uniref:SAM-dependent methyltransferase n=1 Tax=Burkholderia ubonensis TaxID=101571 RepID=A0AB73FQW7_9BURK|nr:hypothetical protein [Burkholderia ubonensis]KVK87617.1 hypothetical protein WJ44_32840 [Burkholderia ubonensis]KVL66145.1 hypothetical protein WJ47_12370 [Burkholderia ubonensis]KVM19882.1 hypothetical protein WJ53_22450 [Burkholderia ubonensis]KVM26764.1 hypothetical protein WJ54_16050 [Burkholderia ubonensis]OJB06921.1 hypothetical protein BGV52_21785 [Burkholderia ubonensis]
MDPLKKWLPALTIDAVSTGLLHRAFVALPDALCEPGQVAQERTVFFESPSSANAAAHLEQLLSAAWCVDAHGWTERGCIYNVFDAHELIARAFGAAAAGELRLLEIGAGPDGVGPDRVYYARAADVDLFVTPRAGMRLRALLAIVEHLYEAGSGPAREPV